MNRHAAVLVIAVAAIVTPVFAQKTTPEAEVNRITVAAEVLDAIMGAADKSIPQSVMEKAEGIAVFPSLLKGGVGVGGERGHGVLSVRDKKNGGWSAPAFLTVTGGSIGLQLGMQAVDLVLIINDQRGLEQLVKNQFKLGADVGVAAGPVGREAAASTDIQLRAQMFSYSRSRGLFAGVTLNGATIRQDRDANERFYGIAYRTRAITIERLGGSPEPSGAWRAARAKHAGGVP